MENLLHSFAKKIDAKIDIKHRGFRRALELNGARVWLDVCFNYNLKCGLSMK